MAGRDTGDQRKDIPEVRNDEDATSRLRDEIQQRAKGEVWAQGEVRSVTNSDGTVTQKFPDGTNTRVEGSGKPPRVLEVLAINGDNCSAFKRSHADVVSA